MFREQLTVRSNFSVSWDVWLFRSRLGTVVLKMCAFLKFVWNIKGWSILKFVCLFEEKDLWYSAPNENLQLCISIRICYFIAMTLTHGEAVTASFKQIDTKSNTAPSSDRLSELHKNLKFQQERGHYSFWFFNIKKGKTWLNLIQWERSL